jgi:hypothetical protein
VKRNFKSCVYIHNLTLIAFDAEGYIGGKNSVQNLIEPTYCGLGHNGHAKKYHALLVSNNVATGIVAAAMVEKCGLLAQRTELHLSLEKIKSEKPSILIVDNSCNPLIDQLKELACQRPFTIYLGISPTSEPLDRFVDKYICKPLTMDGFQPVIFDWIEANLKEKISVTG